MIYFYRIGMTVNNLRKTSKDDEIITVAKSLIKTWKKFVSDGEKKPESKAREEVREERKMEEKSKSNRRPSFSEDEDRSRCRNLLLNAIKGESTPEWIEIEDLATTLEEEIFSLYNQTSQKYKNQIRSRIFNLKDKRNPMLRSNFLLGMISPARLAGMTSEEMASDEMKKQREQMVKKGIENSCRSHRLKLISLVNQPF